MRLRRQASLFRDTALESLTLSIEIFNRPSPVAREHAVVMLLAHSFEMLLKAVIYQRRGTVRDKGAELSHSFGRCVEICSNALQVINDDERVALAAIKQDRDCATHDTISMSDDLLYVHMRSGISIFRRLLRDEFEQALGDLLPGRVIPVSAAPPTDLALVVEQELREVQRLLRPGTRRSAEAAARLRPLLSLDGAATGRSNQPTEAEVGRAERALRQGKAWRSILPGLDQLHLAPPTPSAGVDEVVLRVARTGDGVPVRRARRDEEAEALAYRGVSPFEEFGTKLSKFGETLGLSQHQGHALIEALKLKGDDRAYFVRVNDRGNVQFQGLSARAIDLGRRTLADPAFDLEKVVRNYNAKRVARRRAAS